MTVYGKELFQELLTAAYWLKRHPGETSFRITYNRSRYSLPKPRILQMLRLYLPYIRRFDDEKLLDYLYLHQKDIEKWVISHDKNAVEEISEETLNEIAEAAKLPEEKREQAVEKAVKKEEVRREIARSQVAKSVVKASNEQKVVVPNQQVQSVKAVTEPTPINAAAALQTTELPVVLAPTITPKPAQVVNKPTQNVEKKIEVVRPNIFQTSLEKPKSINIVKTAPARPERLEVRYGPNWGERQIGRMRTLATGEVVSSAAKELSSRGQRLTSVGISKSVGAIRGLLPGSLGGRKSGGASGGTRWNGSEYVNYEYSEEEVIPPYREDDEKKPARWLGLPPLLVIIGGVILLLWWLGASANSAKDKLTGPNPSASPGNIVGVGCPTQQQIDANKTSPEQCKYLAPAVDIFDTNISQSALNSYVDKYSPIFVQSGKGDRKEFERRVNYIVDKAKQAGLNPAIFLGYWKTESNFSTVGGRDMGCAGDVFEDQVNCAMGLAPYNDPGKNPIANCARSKDADSVACKTLKSIRAKPILDGDNPITYPVASLDDFAESYGSRAPSLDGGAINNNCVSTYNKLVEVVEELGACKASSSNQCLGGWPITGEVNQGPQGEFDHAVRNYSVGRYAIDIKAPQGTPIYATFDGTVVGLCNSGSSCDERGNYVEIQPSNGAGVKPSSRVRYLHMFQVAENIKVNGPVSAGQVIGYVGSTGLSTGPHLHYDLFDLSFAPPNLPSVVAPANCDDPLISCKPSSVRACISGPK